MTRDPHTEQQPVDREMMYVSPEQLTALIKAHTDPLVGQIAALGARIDELEGRNSAGPVESLPAPAERDHKTVNLDSLLAAGNTAINPLVNVELFAGSKVAEPTVEAEHNKAQLQQNVDMLTAPFRNLFSAELPRHAPDLAWDPKSPEKSVTVSWEEPGVKRSPQDEGEDYAFSVSTTPMANGVHINSIQIFRNSTALDGRPHGRRLTVVFGRNAQTQKVIHESGYMEQAKGLFKRKGLEMKPDRVFCLDLPEGTCISDWDSSVTLHFDADKGRFERKSEKTLKSIQVGQDKGWSLESVVERAGWFLKEMTPMMDSGADAANS